MVGVGAAGIAVADMLFAHGVTDLIGCDRKGALYAGRPELDAVRRDFAERSNPRRFQGTIAEALAGADVAIGLSGPGTISADAVRTMAPRPIVFALANPTPEVQPEEVREDVAVIATGRSDYPNQINNVLAFPGVFRGALDVRARTVNEEMKLAAAEAIASVIGEGELIADYIIPSVFNRRVTDAVAAAVAEAAVATGVARRGSRRPVEEEPA
jgi:malate dehydrogenase (oxaloacetate-decarboxylating)